jgi:hypothetical protein
MRQLTQVTIVYVMALAASFAAVRQSQAATLTFEDVFGPVSGTNFTSGPISVTIEGVLFEHAAYQGPHYNWGSGLGSGDVFGIWTDTPGEKITFPNYFTDLSFLHGQGAVLTPATFTLVGGPDSVTFTTVRADIGPPAFFHHQFSASVNEVVIHFDGGTGALLGIDNLSFVPEPASIFLCSEVGAIALIVNVIRRRARNKATKGQTL